MGIVRTGGSLRPRPSSSASGYWHLGFPERNVCDSKLRAFIRWAESEGARAEYKQVADRLKRVKAKALGV